MKRFLVALTLTCVLSVSAMAGDIPTMGTPSPAPPAPSKAQSSSITANVILTIISLLSR